ncbi:hypothetical protein V5O48_005917 [Marasmius crinis-equi]|uniref:Ras-domain-containing protein n=1 Tax=Marasmius crinis-equi TaxID=585013 RepID=A0ABR3FKY5_9AGAR
MLTIKLVVIGASGVGKTSLRSQYISGRFSTGYRATIGADFITKVLPHPNKPEESVTLQIWDTAGQERFSSLSSAFFRGADAALLMFDVNDQNTLGALEKWWAEFKDKAPVADELLDEYCCVIVGNKMDLVSGSSNLPVSRFEAESFAHQLVPVSSPPPAHEEPHERNAPSHEDCDADDEDSGNEEPPSSDQTPSRPSTSSSPTGMRSDSIAIAPHPLSPARDTPNRNSPSRISPSRIQHSWKPRSTSSSRFYGGTMTTTHTNLTVYHTPSSSLFDSFESARSSPEHWSRPGSYSSNYLQSRRLTSLSNGSSSSGSTVTPSLFAKSRDHRSHTDDDLELSSSIDAPVISDPSTTATTPESDFAEVMAAGVRARAAPPTTPPPPDRGARLFFTSAKTGDGVRDVFEYIAQRVIRKWEYDENVESRRMSMREGSPPLQEEIVRLGPGGKTKASMLGNCCSS